LATEISEQLRNPQSSHATPVDCYNKMHTPDEQAMPSIDVQQLCTSGSRQRHLGILAEGLAFKVCLAVL